MDQQDLTPTQIATVFANLRPHFRPQSCACIGKAKYLGDSSNPIQSLAFKKGDIYPVYEGPKPGEYMVISDNVRHVFTRSAWEIKLY